MSRYQLVGDTPPLPLVRVTEINETQDIRIRERVKEDCTEYEGEE